MRLPPPLITAALSGIFSLSVAVSAPAEPPLSDGLYARWETPRGAITAELFYELAPLTVANFVGLAEGTLPFAERPAGPPFYDGLTFHRVVPGFVVQGGDPLGTGEGLAGPEFADELTPLLKHDAAGILSMANSGPNTNSCQFFFTLAPVHRLNYKHTVFGRVVRGLDVLTRIAPGDVMTRVSIIRVGARAGSFRADATSLAALAASTPVIAPRDSALPPLLANETSIELRGGYEDWCNEKLHHYAAVTGTTVRVRLLSRLPAAPAGADNFNPLRTLHQQLAGEDSRAATLVFVADEKRWRLWFGDGVLERFGLTPETISQDPGARHLHQLKQAILAPAKKLWGDAGEPRHRALDAAITSLIEALDRPATVAR